MFRVLYSGARTNDAGDDKTGTATQCECLVNEYVGSNVCKPCDAGYTRLAGDDPDSVDTACTTCAANYFADGIGACQACTGARTNDAGDDKTGTATQCECLVNEYVGSNVCKPHYPNQTVN